MVAGRRILVVEDEAIVADMLENILTDAGAVVVGPAGTVAAALRLATGEPLDAAVLDVNLRGERIDPVADVLRSRAIPLVFATGYGEGSASAPADAIIISKPYTDERLLRALDACLLANGPGAAA